MKQIKASNKGGSDRDCPPGNHLGVLAALVDLGTHWESFRGGPEKKVRKIYLVWEVNTVTRDDQGEKTGEKRCWIGKDFNLAYDKNGELEVSAKSNFRQLLESWRGKPYSADDPIDVNKLVGRACQVNVISEKVGDAVYPRVKTVTPLGEGQKAFKPTHPVINYDVDDKKQLVPDAEWIPYLFGREIGDHVMASLEKGGTGRRQKSEGGNGKHQPGDQAPEDDIPF